LVEKLSQRNENTSEKKIAKFQKIHKNLALSFKFRICKIAKRGRSNRHHLLKNVYQKSVHRPQK